MDNPRRNNNKKTVGNLQEFELSSINHNILEKMLLATESELYGGQTINSTFKNSIVSNHFRDVRLWWRIFIRFFKEFKQRIVWNLDLTVYIPQEAQLPYVHNTSCAKTFRYTNWWTLLRFLSNSDKNYWIIYISSCLITTNDVLYDCNIRIHTNKYVRRDLFVNQLLHMLDNNKLYMHQLNQQSTNLTKTYFPK